MLDIRKISSLKDSRYWILDIGYWISYVYIVQIYIYRDNIRLLSMEIEPMRKRDLTLGYTPEFVQRWDILK